MHNLNDLNIVHVYPGVIDDLPPLLYACLATNPKALLITAGRAKNSYFGNTELQLCDLGYLKYPDSKLKKLVLRLRFSFNYLQQISRHNPSLIWYHGAHAMAYHRLISRYTKSSLIIAHAHELYDHPRLRRNQEEVLRRADLFLVPEINRGWILKASPGIKAPFLVVPNRPPEHLLLKNDTEPITKTVFRQAGGSEGCDTFIIYQGLFSPERCLIELIEGFRKISIDNVGLILLGSGTDASYVGKVTFKAGKDSRIVIVPRISPPGHLRVTSGCHVGVILYAPTCLNNIYCAPNKLYEYASYGLGMILPNFPGLAVINERYQLGETCMPTDPESIAAALKKILQRPRNQLIDATRRFLDESETCEGAYSKVTDFIKERIAVRKRSV